MRIGEARDGQGRGIVFIFKKEKERSLKKHRKGGGTDLRRNKGFARKSISITGEWKGTEKKKEKNLSREPQGFLVIGKKKICQLVGEPERKNKSGPIWRHGAGQGGQGRRRVELRERVSLGFVIA